MGVAILFNTFRATAIFEDFPFRPRGAYTSHTLKIKESRLRTQDKHGQWYGVLPPSGGGEEDEGLEEEGKEKEDEDEEEAEEEDEEEAEDEEDEEEAVEEQVV
ncbi:hypothetical protein O3M35_009918 [Rhynocoris fuscipes]|uniref:Uncharacterized protein n=1 Tax=Rhynocoris fuscipes TaxID=488301 RepID=A0AAW1DC98_9HEMI